MSGSTKSIAILAGAGASKAVNPEMYLTTEDFYKRLPESVTGSPLFRSVVDYLQNSQASIDIEVVLWELQKLEAFLDARSLAGIVNWMIDGDRIVKAVGIQTGLSNFVQVSDAALGEIRQLDDSINQCVYQFYGESPQEAALKANWLPLLEGILLHKCTVNLFTTNYDPVIEKAISSLSDGGKFDDGFVVDGAYRNLDVDRWKNAHLNHTSLLTKLHGSVHWARHTSGKIFAASPNFEGSHDKHVILYPGYKGQASEEPFASFHQHFKECLKMADCILAIGFGFRDDYINQLMSDVAPRQIISINPEEVEMPAGISAIAVKRGFDKKAVEIFLGKHCHALMAM